MAFITFLGHKKAAGVYRLNGPATVGRSLDCDVYVPDIYLSRHHCLFEQYNGCWRVVDLESRNGIWSAGRQQRTVVLKPGDTIEIGTIAVMFNEGDPEKASNPTPFGMGFGAADLMDTICTEGIRPADYSKRQASRKAEFAVRLRERLTQMEEQAETCPVAAAEAPGGEEWTELDLEVQIIDAQVLFMYEWEPPIFNPPRRAARSGSALEAVGNETSENMGTPARPAKGGDMGSAARPTGVSSDDYGLHPIAGAPPRRPPVRYQSSPAMPVEHEQHRGGPRRSIRAAARSWLPFGRKSVPPITNMEGCVFHRDTRWDQIKDTVSDWIAAGKRFGKLNPAIAGAIVLGVVVALGAFIRFAPIGKSGPHIYVPPAPESAAYKKMATARN